MNGHTVRVVAKQLGGGEVEELYWVAEPNAEEAMARIRDAVGLTDEDVSVVGDLSAKATEELGLSRGGWKKAK